MATKKTKKPAPKRAPRKQAEAAKTPDEKVLQQARDDLKDCIDSEAKLRSAMQDDLNFCTLDQWPAAIRQDREHDVENGPRPCLTIDKINQYIVQVVNDMRQGKPGINVRPQDDYADPETAKILKGIVRNIEDQSSADIAYAVAGENAAKMGLGYFRITTEYVSEDSDDQEIFIRPIPNTFSVYLGKHVMPDGSDAEIGYVIESMPIAKFKEEFPKAKAESKDFDGLGPQMMSYWKTDEAITVVEEYRIERSFYERHFLADGTSISEDDYAAWPAAGAGPKPPIVRSRRCQHRQLKWRKLSGVEILDSRDLPGKFIPIVEVIGREAHVSGQRVLWGLVRPAKDPLRMYNYWASTITEKMALAPKTPYIGAKGQFEGLEDKWRKANRLNYAYLEYNAVDVGGNAIPRPERQGATPIEAAMLKQMEVIEHDVQTSLGMFKAAVGQSESQQSGKAILALQRESDTATYHFGANQGISIRHAGRIIVDLIPHYYDTKRIVRILGEDGMPQAVQIDPSQDVAHRQVQTRDGLKSIYNPGVGQYDVSITVGPSYNTKRMEAAAMFVELAKGAADPASAAVLRYLSVRNSDSSGADEAAKMLRALLPPQVAQAVDRNQDIPPQAMAQIQQLSQQVQVMNEAGHKLSAENEQLKAGAAQEQAKIAADRQTKMAALDLEREIEVEKAQLARDRAREEASLKREMMREEQAFLKEKALLEARTKIEVAEIAAGAKIQGDQIAAANAATGSKPS